MKKPDLVWVPDENNVLDYRELWSVCKALKMLDNWEQLPDIIWTNSKKYLDNLEEWYKSYKIIYSYPENERKLSPKEIKKFRDIEESKQGLDIMNLVEISAWRYLEKKFHDNWEDVRIRKTTNYDDVKSWMDYIIEYKTRGDDWEKIVSDVVWVDLTVSDDKMTLYRKSLREKSAPKDYLKMMKSRKNKKIWFIPRLVWKIDKNLIYSFTNSYFIKVLEEWKLLGDDLLEECFIEAIKVLESTKKLDKKDELDESIISIISKSKEKAKHLIL